MWNEDALLDLRIPEQDESIIKVIGVGGGGSNAVNHMCRQGIRGVEFVVCNTDIQALRISPVKNRIQIGKELTEGRGAGSLPERGKQSAIESLDYIKTILERNTKMVFITAGMGGGTGTGAAPVIAKQARELGILTIGIVTIPFSFEGRRRVEQAMEGVDELSEYVDALLIICNEKLRDMYGNLKLSKAFEMADNVLTIAAKSIAEIITLPGIINLDFADVNTTMKDGGVALMSNGFGEGEGRVRQAVEDALNSPLLSNNDVKNAKKILFNVYFSEEAELRMEEMNDVHNFMSEFNRDIEVIWGTAVDNTLGNKVKMTILATGFTMDDIPLIADKRRNEAAQMTEEELRLEEERIEKERKERDLIGKYYGASAQKAGRFTSRAKAVVLTQEELDDDALIALIEDNPTYNRDPKIVARARSKVAGEDIQVSAPTTAKQPANQPRQDSQRGGKQVISFR